MSIFAREAGLLCEWQYVGVARSGVATLVALAIAIYMKVPLVYSGPRSLWLRSIAGSFSMVCTFYAFSKLHASDVLTFTNTFPSWVALLSWPMLGEKPSRGVWVAVVISCLGVAIVGHAQSGEPGAEFSVLSVLAAIAAALFTAFAMLGLNRIKGVAPMAVVVHFSAVSLLFCILSVFLFPKKTNAFAFNDTKLILLLLATGTTAAFGQIFLTLAFRSGSATKISVVGLTQVVMVMLAEVVLSYLKWSTKEKYFSLLAIFGATLVLGPTAWLMIRDRKKPPQPEPNPDETELPEVAIE